MMTIRTMSSRVAICLSWLPFPARKLECQDHAYICPHSRLGALVFVFTVLCFTGLRLLQTGHIFKPSSGGLTGGVDGEGQVINSGDTADTNIYPKLGPDLDSGDKIYITVTATV